VMNGNTSDRATLCGFLDKIEKTYGKAKRTWVMDRGIPSEAILQEMRDLAREIFYLVGTPKGNIQEARKEMAGSALAEGPRVAGAVLCAVSGGTEVN